jgi:hypothetical protein
MLRKPRVSFEREDPENTRPGRGFVDRFANRSLPESGRDVRAPGIMA